MINLKYSDTPEDVAKWKQCFASMRRSTLLQSPEYGLSLSVYQAQKKRLIFIEIDDRIAGIMQLMEVGLLKNLIHAVIVDRGPLWCDGYGDMVQQAEFWREFNRLYPRRLGRRRRIIPEMPHDRQNRDILREAGLKRRETIPGYQTIWLDLSADLAVLRSALKKNWRGALKKAERSNITVEWDDSLQQFPSFLQHYTVDKTMRGYSGASPGLLKALTQSFGAQENMLIAQAKLGNEVIAAILILRHGRSATYQAGWTSEEGRRHNAHHWLLWDALRVLKDNQVYDLDLGGINDDTAEGIKKFKEGMGGEAVSLVGTYY